MRLAIIDLGTNSVRFDVHLLGVNKKTKVLHREKLMVRLGQGVFLNGKLDHQAIQRTIHSFIKFKKVIANYRVNKVIALGTSALREASNAPKLIDGVRKATGITIKVISGMEEARLISLGILINEKIPKGRFGLIDIGGGSTEVSLCKGRKSERMQSFPLGTARLQQVFLKRSPPSKDNVKKLRAYIGEELHKTIEGEKWPKMQSLIGSSGTVRALSKILKKTKDLKSIELKQLSSLVDEMSKMNTSQLLDIPGMEFKRVDMVLAGAILLEECMRVFKVKRVIASDYSLRDGILAEQMLANQLGMNSLLGLNTKDFIEKAVRFGSNRQRLAHSVSTAELLFRKLKSVHKLDSGWLIYLLAAAVLRKVGEAINPASFHEHSYYIIKNARFPFVEEWEAEFLAELCRRYESYENGALKKRLDFSKSKVGPFLKLVGLLNLVDAVDFVEHEKVNITGVQVSGHNIKIKISGDSKLHIARFRMEQKKPVVKKIFRRELLVV